MRLDVVNAGGRCDPALAFTLSAKRVSLEKLLADPAPPACIAALGSCQAFSRWFIALGCVCLVLLAELLAKLNAATTAGMAANGEQRHLREPHTTRRREKV